MNYNYSYRPCEFFAPLRTITINILILVCLLSKISSAQNLLNRPESVVFDSIHSRYLVSNWANGCIVQIDSVGNQTYFTTGHGSINGIWISGNVVFAGCSTKVRGFDLATSSMVMDLTIQGALNLNDITADANSHLYVTDFDKKEIIKINTQSKSYSRYVTGLSLNPNGILYDAPNNRLLICSFGYNIPIISISLIDSSSSVVTYTTLAQCDGFAKDNFGNYYISSWATKSIYRFDSDFTNPPEIFYTDTEAPVDISHNCQEDLLAVPIMWLNKIILLPVTPSNLLENNLVPFEFKLFQNYPNPFNPTTSINFELKNPGEVSLKIFNQSGQLVIELLAGYWEIGNYSFFWDGNNSKGIKVSSGVYFYRLTVDGMSITKKMIHLK